MKARIGRMGLMGLMTASLALPLMAQTAAPPVVVTVGTNNVAPSGTNDVTTGITTVPDFLGSVWNTMVGTGLTNLNATLYGTYTPSVKQSGWD